MEMCRVMLFLSVTTFVVLASTVTEVTGRSSRYRSGKYPKRGEDDMVYEATTLPYEGMKSLRLKIISDILEDISILLDKIAAEENLENQQSLDSTTAISVTQAYGNTQEELEAIRKKLAETLANRHTTEEPEKKSVKAYDPRPRSSDEESAKFRRVLTAWMKRELSYDKTDIK